MPRPRFVAIVILLGSLGVLGSASLAQRSRSPSPTPLQNINSADSLIAGLGFSDPWSFAIVAYISVAVLTLLPILWPLIFQPKPEERAADFEQIGHIYAYRTWLVEHFAEVYPILCEWKRKWKALANYRTYYTWWTLLSSVSLPLLIQSAAGAQAQSKLFFTIVSGHTALLIASNRVFHVLNKIRLYQKALHSYNAVYRALRFTPDVLGPDETQVYAYARSVEKLIQQVRSEENPGSEEQLNMGPPRRSTRVD